MLNLNFEKRITDRWEYPKLNLYTNQMSSNFFEYLNEKKSGNNELRIYIHVPFCNSFCAFCQFYKEPYKNNEIKAEKYYKAVIKELKLYAETPFIKTHKVTSIFFGGGDPSIIDYKYIADIIDTINQYYDVVKQPSITVEGNIKNLLNEDRLNVFKEYGVSRVSFGVQTFNESIRKKLLIKPTLKDIDDVVQLIHKVGIQDFALDLMYNLPDQTSDDVCDDIRKAVSYQPGYIDYYSLNLYPNTIFYNDIFEKNRYEIKPDKERELAQNKLVREKMLKSGYNQILSSTFSNKYDKTHEGLYHYLTGGNMLGIGPSARSYLDGRAHRDICSVEEYVNMLEAGEKPIDTCSYIDEEEQRRRLVILKITLLKVEKSLVNVLPDVQEKINQLKDIGYIEENDVDYVVTEAGAPWIGNMQKVLFSGKYASKEVTGILKSIKSGRSAYNQDYMSIKRK